MKVLICPICGKSFVKLSESIYWYKDGNIKVYVCSNSCWHKSGGDKIGHLLCK